MQIHVTPTRLEGVVLVDTDFFRDERGFFIESWHKQRFAAAGLDYDFVQDNHSRSSRGVLRGFHYQDLTAPMGKLVRCTLGTVLDVVVDLRVGSPTFGQHEAVELSADTMRQVMVPVGFGHAFLTLSEFAEVQYKCTGLYTPAAEGSIIWNDPDLAVPWPVAEQLLSQRDSAAVTLRAYVENPAFRYG